MTRRLSDSSKAVVLLVDLLWQGLLQIMCGRRHRTFASFCCTSLRHHTSALKSRRQFILQFENLALPQILRQSWLRMLILVSERQAFESCLCQLLCHYRQVSFSKSVSSSIKYENSTHFVGLWRRLKELKKRLAQQLLVVVR